MSFAFLTSVALTPFGGGSSTSGSLNTTGAKLIVIEISHYRLASSIVVSDNQGNTYTALTAAATTVESTARLYYCINPTTSASHTFTVAGGSYFGTANLACFSSTGTVVYDSRENGNTINSSTTSIQPGSVTPSQNDGLIVSALAVTSSTNTFSINSSFAITNQNNANGVGSGGALAYLIQTTAAAANPTWSWGSATSCAAAVSAAFVDGGGGGGGGSLVGAGLSSSPLLSGRLLRGLVR